MVPAEMMHDHLGPALLPHRQLAVADDHLGDVAPPGLLQRDLRQRLAVGADPIGDRRAVEDDPRAASTGPASSVPIDRSVETRSTAAQVGEPGAGSSCKARPVTPADDPLIHHPAIETYPSCRPWIAATITAGTTQYHTAAPIRGRHDRQSQADASPGLGFHHLPVLAHPGRRASRTACHLLSVNASPGHARPAGPSQTVQPIEDRQPIARARIPQMGI